MPEKIFKNYLLAAIFVIWSLVLAARFAPADLNFNLAIAAFVISVLATFSLYVIKYINENTIKFSLDLTLLFTITSSPLPLWLLGYLYEQNIGPFFKY